MVKLNRVSQAVLAISSLPALSDAHPEHHEMEHALKKRDEHAAHIQRDLDNCASHPKFLALKERAQNRRWEKAQKLRMARGIDMETPYKTKRDLAALETFEDVNHNMTSLGYTESTAASTLFSSYKNVSCILTPEVTQGPYYVTGEYIRTDVTEDQDGVPVHLEYQYIDVSTCDAATGLYLETWQANATGVYSGVIASGNGNDADETNLDKTFLRGVTAVDSDGVAYFDTIFVGHYADRASHIHIITHEGGTEETNGTFSGGTIAHVGQLFFDESLKDVVEATYPYNSNTQAITSNDDDMWAPDEADNSYDPLPDWAYLGDDISDGLLMWISIGIDTSAEYTVSAAARLTADGGVENSDSADGSSTGENSSSMGGQSGGFIASGGGSMGSAPTGTPGGDQGGNGGPSSSVTSSSVSSSLSSSSVFFSLSSSSVSSSLSSSSVSSSLSSSSVSSSLSSSPVSSSLSSSSSIKSSSSSASAVKASSTSTIKAPSSSSSIKAPSSSSSSSSSSSASSSSTHPLSSQSSIKSSSTSSTKTSEKPSSSSSTHKTSTTPAKSSSSIKKSSETTAKTSSSSSSSHKKHHTRSTEHSSSTSSTKKSLTTLTTSGKKITSKA